MSISTVNAVIDLAKVTAGMAHLLYRILTDPEPQPRPIVPTAPTPMERIQPLIEHIRNTRDNPIEADKFRDYRIHMWTREERTITLLYNQGQLRLHLSYNEEEPEDHPIELGDCPLETAIEDLLNSDIVLDDNYVPETAVIEPYYCWPLRYPWTNGFELTLTRNDETGFFFWRFDNHFDGLTAYAQADYEEDGIHEYIADWREGVNNSEYAHDFQVNYTLNGHHLERVYLTYKEHVGLYNPVTLNRENWGATLIKVGKSTIPDITCKGHAMIALESIDRGEHFIRYVHLTTKPQNPLFPDRRSNQAEIEIIENIRHLFEAKIKSQTWIVSRDVSLEAIEDLREDRARGPVDFHIIGNNFLNGNFANAYAKIGQILSDLNQPVITPLDTLEAFRRAKFEPLEEGVRKLNCLLFTIEFIRSKLGIEVPYPTATIPSPKGYISWLSQNPHLVRQLRDDE